MLEELVEEDVEDWMAETEDISDSEISETSIMSVFEEIE